MKIKLYVGFLLILLLALVSAWVVHPKGSRLDLNKIKIPYRQDFNLKLGLDLQGGSYLEYQADLEAIAQADRGDALDSIRDIVERRVNSFGVSEPQVSVSGNDRIIIELPGVKDINEAIKQIGETPTLEFRLQNPDVQATPDAQGNVTVNGDPWKSTGLTGKQLKKAIADIQQTGSLTSNVIVKLQFDEEGQKLFGDITSNNVGKQLAIFLDGEIISAPVIQNAITNGEAVITGSFTPDQAKEMATRLNSGALPVPIKLISQQNVGATLGAESVEKSIIAGIIGLILIVVFMLMNYRLPGLLAAFALIIYAIISIAVFKVGVSIAALILVGLFFFMSLTVSGWFGVLALVSYIMLIFLKGLSPVTLTLAGIAGFILSIGMAVDANILIFERLKEELRAGKDVNKAVEDGFARAWLSIRDSNISSLITTAILYSFGTPSIKGFALTLGIGIILSMFTAITITRTFMKLFLSSRMLNHPWLFGVNRNNK